MRFYIATLFAIESVKGVASFLPATLLAANSAEAEGIALQMARTHFTGNYVNHTATVRELTKNDLLNALRSISDE